MLQKEIRPDKVAIYIRWSTEDQGDGTTLVVQQDGCQHYVMSQGWRVTPSLIFIDDGYSGGTLNRPKLDELRLAIKAGEVDCVVVYKIDRLSRSVMDTVNLVLGEWEGRTFLKSAREPIDTTTAMGKQFFYMLVSYAEWERAVIKERTFSGKLRRAKEGKSPGGPVPYGYRLSGQAGILEIDPEKAETIRRIFRMYLEESGAYAITDALNREGLPSPTGLKWHMNTILKMLKNPVYSGQLVYGKVTTNTRRQRDKSEPWYLKNPEPVRAESQFPAIVSVEDFERVQTLMGRRNPNKTGVRALSSDYLLTGLLRCECGGAMVSHTAMRGNNKVYSYYACQNKKGRGGHGCSTGLIPQAILDSEVERKLEELLQSEEAYRNFISLRWAAVDAQLRDTQNRRRQAIVTVDQLLEQARRLNRDYRSGTLSATLYDENRREIDEESIQVKAQVAHLERLERSLTQQLSERDSLQEIFDLARRWRELSIPQRKFVLRNVLKLVVASKPKSSEELRVNVVWRFADPSPQ
ncbi:MAG TPA: recombinase family protein [Symbiobacteriaceae bacterium]|nr:recombinase family protein [Symbiobacteriaceae bacterium]